MLVSHTYKFIYIKTVKTAGSSVEVALQHNCVAPGTDLDKMTPQLESDYGIVGARGIGMDTARWFNHMPAVEIRDQLPREIWDGYRKICNIRNPWDKTVSWFHFKNPHLKDTPKAEVIGEFRRWLSSAKTSAIGYDSNIYFIDGAPVADDFIRYENLQGDFDRICGELGVASDMLPQLKTGLRGKEKVPYQDYFDEDLQEKIRSTYEKEIALFGWEFS